MSILVLSDALTELPPSISVMQSELGEAGGFSPAFLSDLKVGESDHLLFSSESVHLSPNLGQAFVQEPFLTEKTIATHQLFQEENLRTLLGGNQVLTCKEEVLGTTVRSHLLNQLKVQESDLEKILSLLKDSYPHYHEAAVLYLKQKSYLNVVAFYMEASLAQEFARMVQRVAKSFFDTFDLAKVDVSRLRSLRHFFPFLFTAFVSAPPSLQVKRIGSVSILHPSTDLFLPLWKEEATAVVFAANEKFAPALGVCMNSLLEHTDPSHFYDIIVLESDITEFSKARLELLVSRFGQAKLRFFNPKALLAGRQLQKNPADHISMETYYRFLIADILPQYSKVLYLDCDTVILEDVAKLAAVDLRGKVLGAAIDVEIPALAGGLDPDLGPYLSKVIGLGEGEAYHQAGVLVLDLIKMRSLHSVDEWIGLAGERKYRYNDQDILNKECRGRYYTLPMEWNLVVDCNHRRLPIIEAGPYPVLQEYLEARRHPKLVHYAGFEKPWDAPDSDFSHLFWHYARTSEFYDRLLAMVQTSTASPGKESLLLRLFPRGSKRRSFAKRLFYRTTGS
jgi:lipopolysaccharide biosynthesis glycosyltransferase